MPNTMMGYAGVQPQRAAMPTQTTMQSQAQAPNYATAMPTQTTMQSQAPNYATAMPASPIGGGYSGGPTPMPPAMSTPEPMPFPQQLNTGTISYGPKLPPRGGLMPMPTPQPLPFPFPIGINPPRGEVTPMPFPIGINPPRGGITPQPLPLAMTSSPDGMEALRQAHLQQAQQQLIAQQPQLAGIAALPMQRGMDTQRLAMLSNLARGVRR